MAGVQSFERRGSDKSPGVLLIAYHVATGSAYCYVDGDLYAMPLNVDGQLQISQYVDPGELDWGEWHGEDRETDRKLVGDVVKALGYDFDEFYDRLLGIKSKVKYPGDAPQSVNAVLRNQFAAAAITGILANKRYVNMEYNKIVEQAFDVAELMLDEAINRFPE